MYPINAYNIYLYAVCLLQGFKSKPMQNVLLFILDLTKMFGKQPGGFSTIRYMKKKCRISLHRYYQITKVYHHMHLILLNLIFLPLLKNKISSTSCRNIISLISIYYCEQCCIQNCNGDFFFAVYSILLKNLSQSNNVDFT